MIAFLAVELLITGAISWLLVRWLFADTASGRWRRFEREFRAHVRALDEIRSLPEAEPPAGRRRG